MTRYVRRFVSRGAVSVSLAALACHTSFAASIINVSSNAQTSGADLSLLMASVPSSFGPWEFAIHSHNYIAPNIPDPSFGYVLFEFDQPVVLTGLTVYQHANGITRIGEAGGNALNALVSAGSSFGGLGDVVSDNPPSFPDGYQDHFSFGSGVVGRFQLLTIEKTSNAGGYASFRWYPEFATPSAVPEPASWVMAVLGIGALARRRSKRSGR